MSVSQNPWEQLQQYLAQGNQLPQNIQNLQNLVTQIQSQLTNLNAQQAALNGQLQELLKIPPDKRTDDQNKQIASLQSQMASNQSEIDSDNSELSKDQSQLNNAKASYANFIASNSTQGNANSQLGSQRKTTEQANAQKNLMAQTQNSQDDQAQAAREQAVQTVADYAQVVVAAGADAIDQMNRITNDNNKIAEDDAKLQELKDRIIKDSIGIAACYAAAAWTFGASLAGLAYLAADLANAVKERDATQADEDAAKSDLAAAQTQLKSDLNTLSAANIGQLQDLIDGLFKSIEKLIGLVFSGKASIDDLKSALATVLSFLQMVTTKVHELYQDDQQWMQRANVDGYNAAVHKAQVTYESLDSLQEFAHFMKAVMIGVEVVTDIAAIAGTIASCGTATPAMAALMITMTALTIALSASGVMNKAVEALADKMSSNGATWAKVLANVIITVACCILTCSVSCAVDRLVTAAVQDVTMTVMQKVVMMLRNLAKALFSPEMWQQVLKQMMSKQGAAMAVTYFGTGNGIVNTLEFAYAACVGKANESEEQLEKDDSTFRTLEIIFAILQAVVMAFAAYKGLSGAGDKAAGEKSIAELLGKELGTLEQITMIAQSLQMAANGASALANTFSAVNLNDQADLQRKLGDTEAKMVVTQAVEQMVKIFQGKELESFASVIQQEVTALLAMLRKMSEGELEAGRLLLETAV